MDLYTNNPVRNGGYLTTNNPLTASGTLYYGILKIWSGSLWIQKKLKVYLSSWVNKPVKYWDGDEWLIINSNA
jgi:hypothetical protein